MIFDQRLERISSTVPVNGVATLRELAATASLDDLAARCDVSTDTIRDVARRFSRARTAFCLTHTGVSMNENGTLGEWLGSALNLITDRIDVPGGLRFERGYVDVVKLWSMFSPANKHRSRLRGLETIAGYHAVAELPSEITTPGPGQIRGMLIAYGNPVVSGPDGRTLDDALSQLDLLVSLDLVQRESHRHADWLIPGTHWLERGELHPMLGNLQERPFVQYAHQAIEPPMSIKPEWEFLTDLALAMGRNMFGKPGVNRLIKASRAVAARTRRPGLAFNPAVIQRGLLASGRTLKWKDILARPHGWQYAEPRYGDLADTIQTPDKHVRLAPPAFVAEAHRALADPPPAVNPEFPLLLQTKRHVQSMNSWLNESPGLFKRERANVVDVHPEDAAAAGVADGDPVRVTSAIASIELPARLTDAQRRGVVCIPHGWGSRIFDPSGEHEPEVHGTNRNLLTDGRRLDRLSQTPAFNSTPVRLETASGERS